MASEPVVRRAERRDVEGLLAFDMTRVVRSADEWREVVDLSDRGERLLLVAEVDGVVAGFGQAHRLDADPADGAPGGHYLTGMTVLPSHRRNGLGAVLTRARLDWIGERAAEAWYFADADNVASIRLHEGLGFVEVARSASIHGVRFDGGEGVLFRRALEARPARGRPAGSLVR